MKKQSFVPNLQSALCPQFCTQSVVWVCSLHFVLTKTLTVSKEEYLNLPSKGNVFVSMEFDVCFIHYLRCNFWKIYWELKILIFLQASKYFSFSLKNEKDTIDQLINYWDSVCLLGVYLLYSKTVFVFQTFRSDLYTEIKYFQMF